MSPTGSLSPLRTLVLEKLVADARFDGYSPVAASGAIGLRSPANQLVVDSSLFWHI